MTKQTNIGWRSVPKAIQLCGFAGFFATFTIQIAQLGYYSYRRPAYPIPQRGWTLQLPWTHVVYGSAHDADQLLRFGPYLWAFAGLVLIGVALDKLAAKSRQGMK